MSAYSEFEAEAREMNRRLRFLWLATGVSVVSLVLASGTGRWVWLGVLGLCAGGLALARRAMVQLQARIEGLPKSRRAQARALLRQGRYLLVPFDERS